MQCLRRIQGHHAPTTTKLVEGEGAIASRRNVMKLYWFVINKLQSGSQRHRLAAKLSMSVVNNITRMLSTRRRKKTERPIPFNSCSPPVVFERAPVVRTERGNFLLTPTVHVHVHVHHT